MPIALPPQQPADRFYRGGERIAQLRAGHPVTSSSMPSSSLRVPEDWVASTTALHGEESLGLSTLPDGRLLRDAVAEAPEWWLGAAHLARFGADTKLLTKLLDAGQRLPVHAHPHRSFAAAQLGRAHGKAEAWFILTPGTVHLGLRTALSRGTLAHWVAVQDAPALLGALHARAVVPGDVVYVPPGMLHAIGEGVLLIEVQEPEDLSILLEWAGFELDGARDGHLGLGFDVALGAVDRSALEPARLDTLVRASAANGSALPPEADEYFRIERVRVPGTATLPAGFAVIVVVSGPVRIGGHAHPAGTVLLTAHGEGDLVVSTSADGDDGGDAELILCRPPAAD